MTAAETVRVCDWAARLVQRVVMSLIQFNVVSHSSFYNKEDVFLHHMKSRKVTLVLVISLRGLFQETEGSWVLLLLCTARTVRRLQTAHGAGSIRLGTVRRFRLHVSRWVQVSRVRSRPQTKRISIKKQESNRAELCWRSSNGFVCWFLEQVWIALFIQRPNSSSVKPGTTYCFVL